jgi:membrane fusion protein, copper/silver efflux system
MSDTPSVQHSGRPWLIPVVAGALLLGGLIGYALHKGGRESAAPQSAAERKVLFWTCSMHPQIHANKPGKCPRCPMNLIAVYAGEVPAGQAEIVLSPAAMKLAEIQTSPVVRKAVDAELRLVGTVALDEKSVRQIAARYGGRIDKLHVNFSGAAVKQGEKLAEVYSPDLLSAQEELLQAAKAAGRPGADSGDYLHGLSAKTLEAARQKLLLLGLSEEQVKDIERAGQATDHVAIVAPIAGTVVKKMVNEATTS